MEKTKILIVDNHRVVIEGIMSALQKHPDLEVVGDAADGYQAIELTQSLKPDIVIMDIAMPNMNGMEATKKIKRLKQATGIIIFTMYANKEFVVDLFKSGISAYVLKDDPMADLLTAIHAVRGGGTYFSSMAPTILINHLKELENPKTRRDPFNRLSQREREVFDLLVQGKSIKEIADELFISPKTVESHKYNIMEKLEISKPIDMVKIAVRKNLIKL